MASNRNLKMAVSSEASALEDDVNKVRCTLRIDRETHQRLHMHAIMLDVNPGELIDQLVLKHLTRYQVVESA
jgi:hypothetical protein